MNNNKDLICRCCESSNVEVVLNLGKQPWGNNYIPMRLT